MIYTYACLRCKAESEHQQSIKDAPLVISCESCQEHGNLDVKLTRVISGAPTFVLRGQTWARDGYRSK